MPEQTTQPVNRTDYARVGRGLGKVSGRRPTPVRRIREDLRVIFAREFLKSAMRRDTLPPGYSNMTLTPRGAQYCITSRCRLVSRNAHTISGLVTSIIFIESAKKMEEGRAARLTPCCVVSCFWARSMRSGRVSATSARTTSIVLLNRGQLRHTWWWLRPTLAVAVQIQHRTFRRRFVVTRRRINLQPSRHSRRLRFVEHHSHFAVRNGARMVERRLIAEQLDEA
jgi:hypothetical protein